MNKLKSVFLAGATLFSGLAIAQPISDVSVIPVAITINTTMRLNVVSGGNVEFVINTLEQFDNGIENLDPSADDQIYDTRFTVASSINFDVLLFAEDASFIGTDNRDAANQNTIPLNNVGYWIHESATSVHNDGTEWDLIPSDVAGELIVPLTNVNTTTIIEDIGGLSAGGVDDNDFTIDWELASADLIAVTGQETLLEQSIPQDRYITNVFLVVIPAN